MCSFAYRLRLITVLLDFYFRLTTGTHALKGMRGTLRLVPRTRRLIFVFDDNGERACGCLNDARRQEQHGQQE